MDPRPSYRYLVLSLVPLWLGCAQVPSKAPVIDQGGWPAPPVVEAPPTPAESLPAPGSVADEKIGQSGMDSPKGQDVNGPPTVPEADSAAGPPADGPPVAGPRAPGTPARSGERLTLEDAKSLAMRLNPILRQSLAAVGVAAGNEDIAYSGFLPTVQGSYSYQAFTSQTGFAGTEQGGRFPILPVVGFGPGTQDFNVTEVRLRWAVYQFGRQVAK